LDPATLVQGFEATARGWRADVMHAAQGDWPRAVRAALDARGCTRVAVGAASPLPPGLGAALAGLDIRPFDRPLEAWKAEFFDEVDAGVTAAAAGVADTGTLVLWPGPGEPRTLSLVPPVHVAVLFASRLYASLPAAMSALLGDAQLPTNLVLVSGPSKTADIQQTLAYGAHGPKELVIVLVDDLRAAATAPAASAGAPA
jgi:L-lactate dehydrogenase complex protein LldG